MFVVWLPVNCSENCQTGAAFKPNQEIEVGMSSRMSNAVAPKLTSSIYVFFFNTVIKTLLPRDCDDAADDDEVIIVMMNENDSINYQLQHSCLLMNSLRVVVIGGGRRRRRRVAAVFVIKASEW